MTDYTALCARLDEVSREKQQEAWSRIDGGQDLSIGAMLADEAAAAIRELEARARESAMQELASLGQAQEAYEAQSKAEAKLAEVEKERDEWHRQAMWHNREHGKRVEELRAAEATVATLTAQVEALRDALDNLLEAITASNQIGDRSLTITGPTANLKWLLEACEDARAALTTENQTNG